MTTEAPKNNNPKETTDLGIDGRVVADIIATPYVNAKSETFANILKFVKDNLLLVIIISLLLIVAIGYLFAKYTETGKRYVKSLSRNKVPPADTSVQPDPPAAHNNNNNHTENYDEVSDNEEESYDNNANNVSTTNATANNASVNATANANNASATSTQDIFEQKLKFNINEAITGAIKSGNTACRKDIKLYIVSYTREAMLYPATKEDTIALLKYISPMIKEKFPDIPEILETQETNDNDEQHEIIQMESTPEIIMEELDETSSQKEAAPQQEPTKINVANFEFSDTDSEEHPHIHKNPLTARQQISSTDDSDDDSGPRVEIVMDDDESEEESPMLSKKKQKKSPF
jgi:hypothetical protein